MNTSAVTVGLLSHYFDDSNLGCVALSVSNVEILESAARRAGVRVSYVHLINEKTSSGNAPAVAGDWTVGRIPSTSAAMRRPWLLARGEALEGCDLVININAGDGFTNIYGFPRQVSESYMSLTAARKSIPLILAPQTIGPFTSALSRRLASSVLKRAELVFARDHESAKLARDLGARSKCKEVIDVAFALGFTRPSHAPRVQRPNVGVNVSGLLWRGGYNRDNYFGLSFSYREYVRRLVGRLLDAGFGVHLVGHVFIPGGLEDDLSACEELAELFPAAVVAPRFPHAEAAKSYIAGMDAFTGARMHATIGALSAGVPVVPLGYSDKVRGLYRTLGYGYYVDAREPWTADSAAAQTFDWLAASETLRVAVDSARAVWSAALSDYENSLAELLGRHANLVQV